MTNNVINMDEFILYFHFCLLACFKDFLRALLVAIFLFFFVTISLVNEKVRTLKYRVRMLDNRFISTPSLTAVLLSDVIWWNVNDSGGNFIKLSTNVEMLISRNSFPAVCN